MKIFDIHNDCLSVKNPGKSLFKLKADDSSIVCAIWSTKLSLFDVFDKIDAYHILKNTQLKTNNICYLSFEDLNFIDRVLLEKIIVEKPKWCGLTWNFDNKLGGGCFGSQGLTNFGRKVIKKLENNNILIDVAHLNEKTFWDVARASKLPIVCSHSAFWEIFPHKRNLAEFQIRIILESGGIIGIPFVSDFLGGRHHVPVSDYVKHIDGIVQRFGKTDGLCVGTDFFGTKHLPHKIKDYTSFELVSCELKNLGYSNDDINNIFFANAKKFFQSH